MRHGGQVIDFIRFDVADQVFYVRVGNVAFDRGYALRDKFRLRCSSGQAINTVAFLNKKIRQIKTILTGNAGNKCFQ